MNYRIDYGNGQVWECETLAQAKTEFARMLYDKDLYVAHARIQRYLGDGEWGKVRPKGA